MNPLIVLFPKIIISDPDSDKAKVNEPLGQNKPHNIVISQIIKSYKCLLMEKLNIIGSAVVRKMIIRISKCTNITLTCCHCYLFEYQL